MSSDYKDKTKVDSLNWSRVITYILHVIHTSAFSVSLVKPAKINERKIILFLLFFSPHQFQGHQQPLQFLSPFIII